MCQSGFVTQALVVEILRVVEKIWAVRVKSINVLSFLEIVHNWECSKTDSHFFCLRWLLFIRIPQLPPLCSLCPCWRPHSVRCTIHLCLCLLSHPSQDTPVTAAIMFSVECLWYLQFHSVQYPLSRNQSSPGGELSVPPPLSGLVRKR